MSAARLSLCLWLFLPFTALAQVFTLTGKVTNTRLEPLAFASLQVKELQRGVVSREDGTYTIQLEEGEYHLVVSMIGYRSQVIQLIITRNEVQNFILEESGPGLESVTIRGKARDRAEELIRNVIRSKDSTRGHAASYSCSVYIRALQQDSFASKRPPRPDTARVVRPGAEFIGLSMAEVSLRLDHGGDRKIREERDGVRLNGNTSSLFYLSTTDGEFDFYSNLLRLPALSPSTFLSPLSYSGLLAYRFRTLRIENRDGRKLYTISVKPRQLSNATVEGELTIADSPWVVVHARFSFPKYHLPEYDLFEVEQDYSPQANGTWMLGRQQFRYKARAGKHKLSGHTVVTYTNYEMDKHFEPHHFGMEVSATAQQAYVQDSSFWTSVRTEPLTDKELRFIRYRDSLYRLVHSRAYLDSIDRLTNRITWKKMGFIGQTFYNRQKEQTWSVSPLLGLYQPLQFGGTRINPYVYYGRTYRSRKYFSVFTNISYGLRNKDVNGTLRIMRMYNPFNRAFYSLSFDRDFQYIYEGDAWINMIKRSNLYLNNGIGIGHGRELANGLFLYLNADFALRRSVAGYRTNARVDSLFGDVLKDNQAVFFEPYNALYGRIRLQYTPRQRYIREPHEKVILGSSWPTFYTTWRKGIPGPLRSKVDFDYLEFGIEQQVNAGLLGILHYNVRSGAFLNRKDLRLVDYQFQRRGDPLLFMNPDRSFQALDSTFPLFKRFYQAHFVHEFNGALINKMPLLKKLQLREVGGAGFLVAPERNLHYGELFAGMERIFHSPFNGLSKFKIGVYIVGSAANRQANPIQFKVGITTWDIKNNRWN